MNVKILTPFPLSKTLPYELITQNYMPSLNFIPRLLRLRRQLQPSPRVLSLWCHCQGGSQG